MKQTLSAIAVVLMASTAFAGTPADTVQGNYVEVRSCDVYVAQCFANGEIGVTGEEATLAWEITEGAWNGVDLSGLSVIAVVKANSTLGYTGASPFPTKSVLIVDERATEAQREALVNFADLKAGELVDEVVSVETLPISFTMDTGEGMHSAHVVAGDMVEVKTRCLHSHDKHCGNEVAFYPPLTQVDNAQIAFAEMDSFQGEGLGKKWTSDVRASAYLASFGR